MSLRSTYLKMLCSGFSEVKPDGDFEELLIEFVVDAVNRQIPKRPKRKDTSTDISYCPRCGKKLRKGFDYCHNCGQAIERL